MGDLPTGVGVQTRPFLTIVSGNRDGVPLLVVCSSVGFLLSRFLGCRIRRVMNMNESTATTSSAIAVTDR